MTLNRALGQRWSSRFAVYLSTTGAAVGLGSIWRFPYLAGMDGGSAFIVIFVAACLLMSAPVLIGEFSLGRRSRRSPPEAAGAVAVDAGLSAKWNAIGILGSFAAFLIVSYYSVIAGWMLAYAWKCAVGTLSAAGPQRVAALWADFLAHPLEVGGWHAAFVMLVILISARGLHRGIETADKIRAPGLLLLLLILVAYALLTGDVRRGLAFAFAPNFSAITPRTALAAIGQAFYATGVGGGMMIAYGAYVERGVSLVRTSLAVTGSILLVSVLAAMMIFPLVFSYGMNPAQGSLLVFEVLPRVFVQMPGGRVIGTLFFTLMVLAALTPSVSLLEPTVAWLIERWKLARTFSVWIVGGAAWIVGIGTILSFSRWSTWHPMSLIPVLSGKTFFGVINYVSANLMMPIGAFLTSVFVAWHLESNFMRKELAETTPTARIVCRWLLRYVCPLAIFGIFVATFI